MKIGIITFHRAHNYGAVLQCYALIKTLEKLFTNSSIEVIDYYPKYFKAQYSILPNFKLGIKRWLKGIFKLLPIFRSKYKRMIFFNEFINSLPLSNHQYNEKTQNIDSYDILIFGSDQIWNPVLTNGIDPIYVGAFQHCSTTCVSYAASTNPELCNNKNIDYFKYIINSFDYISTRENFLSDFLNSIKPNSSTTVLDPILLLKEEEWSKIAECPLEKNYLLIYTVPQSPLVYQHAEYIASSLNLKIIEITPSVRYIRKTHNKIYKQTLNPYQFMGYIKFADYVVSTSFHGTAFAIKFRKEFSTIRTGTSADLRSINLLSICGLEKRAIDNNNLRQKNSIIDYEKVNIRLDKYINKSISYLRNCIKKEKN